MSTATLASDELQDLIARSPARITSILNRMGIAIVEGNEKRRSALADELGDEYGQMQALSDLLGRETLLREADRYAKRTQPYPTHLIFCAHLFASAPPPIPKVGYKEAIDILLGREPRLSKWYPEIEKAYIEGRGPVLAKDAEFKLSARIGKEIAKLADEGKSFDQGAKVLARMHNWTQAHSYTVYRTTLSMAFNAGRFRQVMDPDVAEIIGAFEYDAILDSDVRPNHRAAQNLLASVTDPIWDRFTPPLGFNCRCALRMVDRFELRRRGLLSDGRVRPFMPSSISKAGADEGFGVRRPDRITYGR